MIRLSYASTTTHAWTPEELLALLTKCQTNNAANNITGILLYAKETFFQVLEGEEEVVNKVYELIEKDKRHKDCTITERDFPYWSMGFEKIDTSNLHNIRGLNDFLAKDFTPSGFASHKNIVAPLLAHLRGRLIKQVSTSHEELPMTHDDPFLQLLNRTIRVGVKFMAVLIAIEIFLNITLYIRSDVIPVKLVVATALMAISRKIIVLDYKDVDAQYVTASALVVVALGITYWLVQKHD